MNNGHLLQSKPNKNINNSILHKQKDILMQCNFPDKFPLKQSHHNLWQPWKTKEQYQYESKESDYSSTDKQNSSGKQWLQNAKW